jgi:hypothetical protein
MNRATVWPAIPAMLLALVLVGPFHDKAFTIDDTLFLKQAAHAVVDPLHPSAFHMVWDENVPVRVSSMSGPVMPWLLVPAVLTKHPESVAHATQLVLFLLALLATVSLALRFGLHPAWAMASGLLLAAAPAVLAMAGTAMPDVAAMALGILGLERLVAWRDAGRAHQGLSAAALLGLAPLARSHLVLLLGIGLLLVAGDFLVNRTAWRNAPRPVWLPLAAAPLLTAAVIIAIRDPSSGTAALVTAPSRLSSATHLIPNSVAFATHWVLALPLAIPWALLRPMPLLHRWWAIAGAMVVASLLLQLTGHPLFPIAPIAALGAVVLIDILADGWKRRDAVQVTLGLWLLVPFAPAPYSHLPSKYLLAAAPAAAILLAREMALHNRIWSRAILAGTVAVGLAVGMAILRADEAFAGLGRRAAAELVGPNVASGHRVWFAGHWGFQWYAEQAGGRILTLTPPYPASGDLIVTSRNSEPGYAILEMLGAEYPRVSHLARLEDRKPGGRIMNVRLGAGFFSNAWGYLPWAWGDEPLDTFDLWRIE